MKGPWTYLISNRLLKISTLSVDSRTKIKKKVKLLASLFKWNGVMQKTTKTTFWIFLSSPFLVDHFCQKFVIAQFISERFNYTNNIPKFPLTSKLPHIQWNNCQFPFFKLIRAYLRNFLSLCFNNIIVFLKFYSSLIKSCSLTAIFQRVQFLITFRASKKWISTPFM